MTQDFNTRDQTNQIVYLSLSDTQSGTDTITGKSRTVSGTPFILGHPIHGVLGTSTLGAGWNAYSSGTFAIV